MRDYRFRTNWRGKLILQYRDYYRNFMGDREYFWRDAKTEDLRDYFTKQNDKTNTPNCV